MRWGLADLSRFAMEIKRRRDYDDYNLGGDDGTCFIINDEVLKIYWTRINRLKKDDLSEFKSNRIAFPKYYIKDKEWFYAEIMPYFPYQNCHDSINLKTKIEILMENYRAIVNEISKFSTIHMTDLGFTGNILYSDKDGFYLIDTTCWEKEEWPDTKKSNIRKFDGALFMIFSDLIGINSNNTTEVKEIYPALSSDNLGKEFLEILDNNLHYNYHFEELIKIFQSIVSMYFHGKIQNIEDIKKYHKILKK